MSRLLVVAVVLMGCATARPAPPKAVVVVSANMEWKVVKAAYPTVQMEATPWGETFETTIGGERVVMFHGGWGKVAAAGSAQYVIDRWRPRYVVNLRTAGGFAGAIERHSVVLVDRTVIYDMIEAMGDSAEAIASYMTTLDLWWLQPPYPSAVTKTLLVSGDRDLVPAQLGEHAVEGRGSRGVLRDRRRRARATLPPTAHDRLQYAARGFAASLKSASRAGWAEVRRVQRGRA